MPNLNWYGTETDHFDVLTEIIESGEVTVYEHYSRPDHSIRTFNSAAEILAEFDIPYDNGAPRVELSLNLWVHGAGPAPEIVRIALNPQQYSNATWRERSGTMGFIQFHLCRPVDGKLMESRTNTVSEARMGATGGIFIDHNGNEWDVRKANRLSSRINRDIKKRAVAKIGAAVVLPGAAAMWEAGEQLGYHYSKTLNPQMYRLIE